MTSKTNARASCLRERDALRLAMASGLSETADRIELTLLATFAGDSLDITVLQPGEQLRASNIMRQCRELADLLTTKV